MTDIVVSLEKIKEGLRLVESALEKMRPVARLKAVEALDLFWKGLSGSRKIREGSFEWALFHMKAGKRVRREGHTDRVNYLCIQQLEHDKEPRFYLNLDGPGSTTFFDIPQESILANDWIVVSMRLFRFDDDGSIYTIAAKSQKSAEELFALNLVEEGREDEEVKLEVSEYPDDEVIKERDEDTNKVRDITARQLSDECKVETVLYCSDW